MITEFLLKAVLIYQFGIKMNKAKNGITLIPGSDFSTSAALSGLRWNNAIETPIPVYMPNGFLAGHVIDSEITDDKINVTFRLDKIPDIVLFGDTHEKS